MAHLMAKLRRAQKLQRGGGKRGGVGDGDKQAGDAVLNRVARTGSARGDDGKSAGGSFKRGVGKAFAMRRKEEEIHGSIAVGDILNEAGEDDLRMALDARDERGVQAVFGTVEPADEQKPGMGGFGVDAIKGIEQFRDAFVACESPDETEEIRVGGDGVTRAQISGTGMEAVKIDAVAAAVREQAKLAARRDGKRGSSLQQAGTVAENDVGAGGGETLGGEQQPARRGTGGLQTQAAERVDANGNAQQTGCDQAKQGGLGRAEIDDRGTHAREQRKDADESHEIGDGSDAASNGDGVNDDALLGGQAIQMRARRGDDRDGKTGVAQGKDARAQDEKRLVTGDAEEDGSLDRAWRHGVIIIRPRRIDGTRAKDDAHVCWETVGGGVNERAEERRRILLMVPHLGGGGAERVMARVAAGVDAARFEVHLAVVTDDEPGATQLPEWVEVHRLEAQRVRRAAPGLVRLIGRIRPEVVVPGMMHLSALVLALRPLLPRGTRIAPRVNTSVSGALTGVAERRMYAWLMRGADAVICQSEAMARDVCAYLGVARAKMLVAENPVDVEGIRAEAWAARQRKPREGCVHVVCVGRLAREKGIDLLLEAWARVVERDARVRLTVVGEGAERDRLEAMRKRLGLEATVALAGFQSEIARWLGWADVYVQPSRYEGMPNAMLEAAAAGLALVTTPSSEGVVRLLRHREGAWIARERSSEALAEALTAAVRSARERMDAEATPYEHSFLEPFAQAAALRRWEQCLLHAAGESK